MIPEATIRSAMITARAYGASKIMRPCESGAMKLAKAGFDAPEVAGVRVVRS